MIFASSWRDRSPAKYGLDEVFYLGLVAPVMMQHESATQWGTAQATAISSLIGDRQTKQSKAVMAHYGLRQGGHLVGEDLFVRNPYEWAKQFLEPKLAKAGLTTDEAHRDKLIEVAARMFSNRNTGEFLISMLLNSGLIEKEKGNFARAKDISAAPDVPKTDLFTAGA